MKPVKQKFTKLTKAILTFILGLLLLAAFPKNNARAETLRVISASGNTKVRTFSSSAISRAWTELSFNDSGWAIAQVVTPSEFWSPCLISGSVWTPSGEVVPFGCAPIYPFFWNYIASGATGTPQIIQASGSTLRRGTERDFYRRRFNVTTSAPINWAYLYVFSDDNSKFWINGQPIVFGQTDGVTGVGASSGGIIRRNVTSFVQQGANLLSASLYNQLRLSQFNPMGLQYYLVIDYTPAPTPTPIPTNTPIPTPTPTPLSFGPGPGEPEVSGCGLWSEVANQCVAGSEYLGAPPDVTMCGCDGETGEEDMAEYCCVEETDCIALCGSPGDPPPQCPADQSCTTILYGTSYCDGTWMGTDGCSDPDGEFGNCCYNIDVPPPQCPAEQQCIEVLFGTQYCDPGTFVGTDACSNPDGELGNCCLGEPPPEETCNPGYVCDTVANCEEFPEPGIPEAANTYPANCTKTEPLGSQLPPANSSGNCCIEYVEHAEANEPIRGCTDTSDWQSSGGIIQGNECISTTTDSLCYYVECGDQGSATNICSWPPRSCKASIPEYSDDGCGTIQAGVCTGSDGLEIPTSFDCSDFDCEPTDWDCRNQWNDGSECCDIEFSCSNYKTTPDAGNKQKIFCDKDGNATKESTDDDGNPNPIYTAIGCIPTEDLNAFTKFLLQWGMGIAGGIAMLLIVYAGFLIKTSQGHPHKLQAGKELMTAAIAGLMLLVFGAFLLRLIGIDILQIPGF